MISKKIVLVGDFSTGKTSLIRRFVDNQFSDSYLSTIGVKISKKIIELHDDVIQALIWDIEGGTAQKPVNTTYLIGAHGCILVADITRKETIDHLENYIGIVKKVTPKAAFVLVLNKSDMLNDEEKQTVYEETKAKYQEYAENIYLTSAKTGEEVENLFMGIAVQVEKKG